MEMRGDGGGGEVSGRAYVGKAYRSGGGGVDRFVRRRRSG